MMKFKLFAIVFCISTVLFSCERTETLPPNHAKGKIILITTRCYGETVVIEVNNPDGLGVAGVFSEPGKETESTTYNNAIGVPYFEKIGLPDSIPQTIGTELYFEYRELTSEEWENGHLFESAEPIACYANIIPPNTKKLIITNIINYK